MGPLGCAASPRPRATYPARLVGWHGVCGCFRAYAGMGALNAHAPPGTSTGGTGCEALMILPLTLYIALLTFVPVIQAILLQLHRPLHERLSDALELAADIVGRPDFGSAFVNTVGITLIGVTLEMSGRAGARGSCWPVPSGVEDWFRTIMLTPMGVPTLVAGAAMLYFFRTNGYLNELLLRARRDRRPGLLDRERPARDARRGAGRYVESRRRSSSCCYWPGSNRSRATSTRRPTSTARVRGSPSPA